MDYRDDPLTDRVFHDVVKSIIQWNHDEILALAKTVPSLKASKLLTGKTWVLDRSLIFQEYTGRSAFRTVAKFDGVWTFRHCANPDQHYRLIHEVKTGRFDPFRDIYNKYYSWQQSQIWVWCWGKFIPSDNPVRSVRYAPIEYLLPLLKPHIDRINTLWGTD